MESKLPPPANGFQRLVDRILGEEVLRRSHAAARRYRMAVGSTLQLLLITVLLALPITYWLEGFSATFWVLCAGTALSPLNLTLPRLSRSETLPGFVACLQSISIIIGSSLAGGPVGSVAILWHMIVPLTAGLLAGARAALLCGGLSVTHLGILIILSARQGHFADNSDLWIRTSLLALVFFAATFAWTFETARARAEEELERKHQDERMRLEEELEIATRIQSSILPGKVEVPSLEIAARMVPASTVGGDYYDFLPMEGGCWIGIGDVSGHGLDAGLIMMMLQSIISSLSRYNPKATPRELLTLSNQVLFHNIRSRLKRDDYITLTLMRYEDGGDIVLSGAHEELIIYRAREGRCERMETRGAWIGAMRDVARFMVDMRIHLEPGDVMLLHTDGITEAMNAQGEMFGLDRLAEEFQRVCREPAEQIVDHIMLAVRRWTEKPQDDMTVVALRHRGLGSAGQRVDRGEQPGSGSGPRPGGGASLALG